MIVEVVENCSDPNFNDMEHLFKFDIFLKIKTSCCYTYILEDQRLLQLSMVLQGLKESWQRQEEEIMTSSYQGKVRHVITEKRHSLYYSCYYFSLDQS